MAARPPCFGLHPGCCNLFLARFQAATVAWNLAIAYNFDNPQNLNNNHLIFSQGHVSPLQYSTYKEIGNTFIVVEGHWPEGGPGDAVLEALSKRGGPMPEVVKLAVRSMPDSGTPAVLMDAASISARHIVATVEALVRRKQEQRRYK